MGALFLITFYLFRETSRYGMGSETPMHPSRTPMHPYMTPMRDARGQSHGLPIFLLSLLCYIFLTDVAHEFMIS